MSPIRLRFAATIGGAATVKVTLKEGKGWFKTVFDTDTISIPKDDNNNKIADAWEKDKTKNWTASADNEDVPKGTYTKGDGWSVYEEYRGVFLTSTDAKVTRLNPNKKDVLICYEDANIASYGTGTYSTHDSISIRTIENNSDLINDPFADVLVKKGGKWVSKTVNDAGWVNKNVKDVPGASTDRVWAIRVVETDLIGRSDAVGRDAGDAWVGSPSYKSMIRIHTENIKRIVWSGLEDEGIVRSAAQRQQDASAEKDAADDALIKTSADIVISATLSHEIGHTLALSHCSHNRCIMVSGLSYRIDTTTNKYVMEIDGFDIGHNLEYAATGVINDTNSAVHGSDMHEHSSTPSGVSLSPSDGLYTATAGTGHEANFTSSAPYTSLSWYVKTPSDAYSMYQRTDSGNGSSTAAQFSYSFPSGVSGDYVFMAMGTAGSAGFEERYTVTVSLPSTSIEANTVFEPTGSSSYTIRAGDTHTAFVRTDEMYNVVHLYLISTQTSWYSESDWGQCIASSLSSEATNTDGTETTISFTMPSGSSGEYKITAQVVRMSDLTQYTMDYKVTITTE